MDESRKRTNPSSTPAAIVSVLTSDDLLGEILLRLAFPTHLIHAAAVCRRWLRVASDRALLARFRARHPPPLLGFYSVSNYIPKFWRAPGRHPPEIASAIRRAASLLDESGGGLVTDVVDSRGGHLLVNFGGRDAYDEAMVVSPLLLPTSSS
ncbi:hypothetical protein PR202_gb08399 [Eleusine coracana subsp. coracana]|uniref:F-box domain-containing protein n=1 Tax=Eleusine coracana subsp. coracana TaxID=191504 RepID=A0AAV5EE27_ELECO|nr:hypothetical protein PR202_gb08399 [Eleusine coracana subsp. coracana]